MNYYVILEDTIASYIFYLHYVRSVYFIHEIKNLRVNILSVDKFESTKELSLGRGRHNIYGHTHDMYTVIVHEMH